jgi:predicted metallopeptidase
MDFVIAPDIQLKLKRILGKIQLPHIDYARVICFRSFGSKSRAVARIWSLPHIWQLALKLRAHYCLEVISHHFDKLPTDDQIKVLIHELLHIPKNFSGSLLPHRSRWRTGINKRNIEKLFEAYQKR